MFSSCFVDELCYILHVNELQAELGRPTPSQPDRGKVSINIDCSATAAPIFQVLVLLILLNDCYL